MGCFGVSEGGAPKAAAGNRGNTAPLSAWVTGSLKGVSFRVVWDLGFRTLDPSSFIAVDALATRTQPDGVSIEERITDQHGRRSGMECKSLLKVAGCC